MQLIRNKYDKVKQEINGVFDTKSLIMNTSKFAKNDVSKSSSFLGKTNNVKLSEFDIKVIEDYTVLKNKLDIKKHPKVYIDVIECDGTIPEAREYATL